VSAPPPESEVVAPVLFSLECVFSEGVNLSGFPYDQRRLVHYIEFSDDSARPFCSHLIPFQVGRAFQPDIFDGLIALDEARSTISREHFQICMHEVHTLQPRHFCNSDEMPACSFSLVNLSGNGTQVNDVRVQGRGESCELHHHDLITFCRSVPTVQGTFQVKFLQFRFDLSQSCVRDAQLEMSSKAACGMPVESRVSGASSSDDGSFPISGGGCGGLLCSSTVLRDCSDCGSGGGIATGIGLEGAAAFVLEVCGPAVDARLPIEDRCIQFALPPSGNGEDPQLYSSLMIGRAHQLDFWQAVLYAEAFNTLSRQHFEVQTWRSGGGVSFLVRNLSDVNPVHVRSGAEETAAEPPAVLECSEQRHLLDGDEIVLNFEQEHTFWLIFRDLTASTSIFVAGSSTLHKDPRRALGGWISSNNRLLSAGSPHPPWPAWRVQEAL